MGSGRDGRGVTGGGCSSAVSRFPPHEHSRYHPSGRTASPLAPHRDVLLALAAEWSAVPVAPPVLEFEAGQARHQVQLGGPRVPERHRALLVLTVAELEVVRDQALVGDVVLVKAE